MAIKYMAKMVDNFLQIAADEVIANVNEIENELSIEVHGRSKL